MDINCTLTLHFHRIVFSEFYPESDLEWMYVTAAKPAKTLKEIKEEMLDEIKNNFDDFSNTLKEKLIENGYKEVVPQTTITFYYGDYTYN